MPSLPEALTLDGDSLQLRDWRDADAPALEAVCGEWNVCRFTSVPWSYSLVEATAWVTRNREKRSRGEVLSLAIVEAGRDEVVGNVNLGRFSDDGARAALGYWLVPSARGRGLASVATDPTRRELRAAEGGEEPYRRDEREGTGTQQAPWRW